MNTLNCIKERRSVRKYLEKDVPRDMIGQIIEAGTMAPSSGNIQNWNFTVIKNKETKAKIADACLQQNWMTTAPVHIVVCGIEDLGKQFYGIRGERLYTLQNCAASIQNMLLAAKDLGLGTCWVGAFDERMLKEIVGIADNARPQAIITLGFPAEVPKIPNKEPLYNVYFIESYNGRIEDMDAALGFHGNVIRRELKKAGETAEKKGSKILSKLKEQGKEILKKAKRNK